MAYSLPVEKGTFICPMPLCDFEAPIAAIPGTDRSFKCPSCATPYILVWCGTHTPNKWLLHGNHEGPYRDAFILDEPVVVEHALSPPPPPTGTLDERWVAIRDAKGAHRKALLETDAMALGRLLGDYDVAGQAPPPEAESLYAAYVEALRKRAPEPPSWKTVLDNALFGGE